MAETTGFEKWLEDLKKKNPDLHWDLMHENTMRDLRELYDGQEEKE